MAGHSHAANVARRKASVAAKRQKIFTKAAKDVIVAARDGGRDPSSNASLRFAIEKAKAVNMPKDKIEYAILRGIGEVPGETYVEGVYEGYGPGGIAIIVDALTDNIHRTAPEMRHLFSKNGGNLGEVGCVSWDFKKKGLIIIPQANHQEDAIMEAALEAGAEDFSAEDGQYEIITSFEDFYSVLETMQSKGYQEELAEITKIPGNKVALDVETGLLALKLIDLLEDQQDSQNVYTNLDYTEDLLKAAESP